jgi:general secretion pathway protein E
VHANSLSDVMGRFLHFNLDMFGFTSALNGIVVQRLLRKLCPKCAQWAPLPSEDAALFESCGLAAPTRLKMPQGCGACSNTGYQGRFVLAEVHTLDDELRDLVLRRASIMELKRHARTSGVTPLFARGLDAVARGETTLVEVRRVIGGA